jgi:hypothetical protein
MVLLVYEEYSSRCLAVEKLMRMGKFEGIVVVVVHVGMWRVDVREDI